MTDRIDSIVSRLLAPDVMWDYTSTGRRAERIATLTLPPSGTLTIEKHTVVATVRDLMPADPLASSRASLETPFDSLHAAHAAAWSARFELDGWEQRWKRAGSETINGTRSPASQAVRLPRGMPGPWSPK